MMIEEAEKLGDDVQKDEFINSEALKETKDFIFEKVKNFTGTPFTIQRFDFYIFNFNVLANFQAVGIIILGDYRSDSFGVMALMACFVLYLYLIFCLYAESHTFLVFSPSYLGAISVLQIAGLGNTTHKMTVTCTLISA